VIEPDDDEFDYWVASNVWWSADVAKLRYRHMYRGYRKVTMMEVDTATGTSRAVIEETSETRIHPTNTFAAYAGQNTILWTSRRSGWRHLYSVDAATRNATPLTSGEWEIRGAPVVDEEKGKIWFEAGGREPDRDPYLVHQYVMNLDGSDLKLLTPEAAQHVPQWSSDRGHFVDTYSRVDQPPVHVLRNGADGTIIKELRRGDDAPLREKGWTRIEPFKAKGRDGKTDIYGNIYRPTNLDPAKKYPVIEYIYAGPHAAHTAKTYRVTSQLHRLAELGFICVQMDGMGTDYRGKAFHDVSHKNLGDAGFPDRIAWIKAAAARYPQMDLSPGVGIFGYSAGGYDSTRALLAYGDFYSAAVSLAGNHDHRTDKTWWNELWMGWPMGPEYEAQANPTNAHKLTGKLLLIHGENDTNVNIHGSTMRLAAALIKADKDFDMFIMPGRGHNLAGTYIERKIAQHFVRSLYGKEPGRTN
jgi:dipeptidyl aminopeptidase/acylaminoacyl peptidase